MNRRTLLWAVAAALFAALATPWLGPEQVHTKELLSGDAAEWRIFLALRVSRSLLAFLAGGSLAITGAVFQALLRNSLATPYTLGVSSGAALGAVIAICLRVPVVPLAALAGGIAVLLLVLRLSSRWSQLSSHALILAGVSVTSVCSALITILHSYAGFSQSFAITSWLIGGVDAVSFSSLGFYAAAVLPVWALLIYHAPAWNLMAFGESWAAARGLNVRRTSLIGYLAGSWLAALTVSLTGPIGFVGLLVPHFIRESSGSDHRTLVPASALFGAAFLCACDAIGRTVLAPSDIPAGVITAILGGPGLVWMLSKERG
ncbi:MAG: iron ABC transporter permease [Candidatus Solibacter usitatus]|nr:iron ABC transporter permease [Candidatus Solibacter usitatus]